MAKQVVTGATLRCNQGMAPGVLVVLPLNRVTVNNVPAANIMDFTPIANILPFGMCRTQANPMVAAATAAAMGTPTPAPCIPATVGPWSPGSSSINVGEMPALTDQCTCTCAYGGTIDVVDAGQSDETIEA